MQTLTPEQLLGPLNAVEAKNAPRQIHCAGDLGLLRRRRVSIVGSRTAGEEAIRRATRLARELSRAGVVVVSGLAEGIDTAAHKAAIEVGGHTIAVLGNGLTQFYPAENRDLQATIERDHLLLSEFAQGTPPKAGNFPARNRTMALVSQATVIVDAQERSGTVSQAWEAIRLGRQLFLMRSLVDKAGLEWPKLVMQYGADILDSSEQLIELLPPTEEFQLDAAAF
jgi:DNA processing protein